MELNNRELASALLLGGSVVLAAWHATRSVTFRRSLASVCRAFAKPAVLMPFIGAACWVALLVLGGRRVGIWNAALAYDTALWIATLAVVAMVGVNESLRDRMYIRKVVLRTVEVGVLLELVVNLYVLPLPAELVMQALLAAVAVLLAVARQRNDEHRHVASFLEGFTALVGLALFSYVTYRLAIGWRELDGADLVRSVVLPVWLTIGFAPYLALFSSFVAYDQFVRRAWRQGRHPRRVRARRILAALVAFRGSRTVAGSAPFYVARDVARASDNDDAYRLGIEWREEFERRADAQLAARQPPS